MRAGLVAGLAVPLVVLAGAGGYAWADAEDVVPGWITLAPEPVPPAPFIAAGDVPAVAPASSPLAVVSDGAAPMPDAATLTQFAQELRDDSRTGRSTGVSVVDLATGEVLVDLEAADGQVPASVTKVLTAVAVVHELGPDYRLTTTALYDPTRGEVAVVAGGDMMLAADAGHGGEPGRGANGYAGLGDLADQVSAALAAQGVTEVRVVRDVADFPGPAWPAEWPAYARYRGYAAPVTGMAVNVGRQTNDLYALRWPDPAAHAADEFAARLAERGIAVTSVGERANAGGDVVGTVASAPLSQVAEYMLATSDNTIAETFTRVLAVHAGRPATPTESMALVVAELEEMGIATGELRLYDGAGFSTRNRIPPAVLTDAIVTATAQSATSHLADWLPIAAMEGTLTGRYGGSDGAGTVRAKTGSLTGVTSLAGVVITADGRALAFAVLADGMPYGQERPRAAIDEFVTRVAGCGCQGGQ